MNFRSWNKSTKLTRNMTNTFYKSYTWQKCRQAILIRDDYLCQVCLKNGEPIPADTVHHIIHLRDDPSKALDSNNLMSVCFDCHNDLHPEKGFGSVKDKEIPKGIKVFKTNQNPERTW